MKLSIILPVHNQESIIVPVVKHIIKTIDKLQIEYEIILIENGSRDNTLNEIAKLHKMHYHIKIIQAPLGYGSAIIAGLSIIRGYYVCYMPSDGQVDLSVLHTLWEQTTTGHWDIVKIKRITRETHMRTFVSKIFSLTMAFIFNIPVLDINGSPRIFQRKLISKLNLQSKDSFIDAEFAIKANLLGLTIHEVPMKTLARLGGESTRSWKTFAEFFYNIAHYKYRQVRNLK